MHPFIDAKLTWITGAARAPEQADLVQNRRYLPKLAIAYTRANGVHWGTRAECILSCSVLSTSISELMQLVRIARRLLGVGSTDV
eukprot:3935869-Rhodomonas_salina.5